MYEWENRKVMHIHHKKLVEKQKKDKEKLEKQQRQEIAFVKFKEWLKNSLIKQKEEEIQKKIEKRQVKEEKKHKEKEKQHRKVLAKIAYKDWVQTKKEEDKLKRQKQ